MSESSSDIQSFTVTAINTAKEVENKIHDDTVAKRIGFAGGLVPGLTSFAYMMQLPLAELGASCLKDTYITARFVAPVYEGDTVKATLECSVPSEAWDLRLLGMDGDVRALGGVSLHPSERLDGFKFHTDARPPADPAGREPLVLGREPLNVAHPAIVLDGLQRANDAYVRSSGLPSDPLSGFIHPARLVGGCVGLIRDNFVRPGPAIHVGFRLWSYRPARIGERLTLFGGTTEAFDKRDKRFLVNDAQVETPSGEPIARILNTAIYFGELR